MNVSHERRMKMASVGFTLLISSLFLSASAFAADPEIDFFEAKIRPILIARCYKCHSAETGKTHGGLALDTRSGWEKGGENGPALVPGKAEAQPAHQGHWL